jgi:peptide/nickel transport system permease protein
MISSLQEPFIDTARVKGVRETRVRYLHALRDALGPVVTLIGLMFGALVGGLIIVEQIFNIPGLGRGVLVAIRERDFPYIVAASLAIAIVYIAANLVVDLLYPILDPRQRDKK